MKRRNIGDRVGAVLSANQRTGMRLIGFGVYDGDFIPPGYPMGMSKEEWNQACAASCPGQDPEALRPTNPRITLDDGDVVWGQQCWWGDADGVKGAATTYGQLEFVTVDGKPKPESEHTKAWMEFINAPTMTKEAAPEPQPVVESNETTNGTSTPEPTTDNASTDNNSDSRPTATVEAQG